MRIGFVLGCFLVAPLARAAAPHRGEKKVSEAWRPAPAAKRVDHGGGEITAAFTDAVENVLVRDASSEAIWFLTPYAPSGVDPAASLTKVEVTIYQAPGYKAAQAPPGPGLKRDGEATINGARCPLYASADEPPSRFVVLYADEGARAVKPFRYYQIAWNGRSYAEAPKELAEFLKGLRISPPGRKPPFKGCLTFGAR